MHRSRHPMDVSVVVDDDNDDDASHQHFTPSTTGDYSSLNVDSPSDTMYHRIQSPSPSPTSSTSLNNHNQDPQPTTSSSSTTASTHQSRRRLSHSTSFMDLNGSSSNIYRDRIRFNTWPRHRKEKRDILVEYDKRLGKSVIQELGIGINKTYRNPWGNLSYAQLITRAIDSSPWKRLTLNEVYEWIIKFVPYFKDKVDAKTSWGWKNSIRHNLSLHNQFIRVPVMSSLSKGPVKYVWTINPSFTNNSPYKKYSIKRKRAAAAAALASQAAAAAAAVAASNINSASSSLSVGGISGLPLSQDRNSPSSISTQPLINMSNNYHRQSSLSTTTLPKSTRINEHTQVNNTTTALNPLSVAAAMMSASSTDPAAYRAFLNSQAAVMLSKHKQQALSSASNQQVSSISQRPTQSSSKSFSHDTDLPVPKRIALGTDRYKQQQQHEQQQQQQQHAKWLLNPYHRQQQQQQQQQPAPPPPYNNRNPHQVGSSKVMVNQSRSPYLPPPSSTSSTCVNADMNNMPSSLPRCGNSPPPYSSAVAAQNKTLAHKKLWYAAVQAAAQAQQHYHHSQPSLPPQAQSTPVSVINELQNYINCSNSSNGNHNKMPNYINPETLKLLSSVAATSSGTNNLDEQHVYSNDPRYKLMCTSYPNTATGPAPQQCLIRQRINQNNSPQLTQQQIDIVAAAYHNYRRRSSGFSSTTSHGGPSDEESDEYIPPRKDSSTSNASSGYESGIAASHQSPPVSSSIRTESSSSIASEASTSSFYYNSSSNSSKSSNKRIVKSNLSDKHMDIDDRQQLSLNSVSGYVDELMERIRKMPPKKRSKLYQMLDEERLKDLNNNNQDNPRKSKIIANEDIDNEHHIGMDVSMPSTTSEVHSDDEDRTLIELKSNKKTTRHNNNNNNNNNDDDNEDDDDNEELKEKLKQQQICLGLNEKSYEELRSMGIPLAVLQAIAFQQHQQTPTLIAPNNPLSNFLTNKCAVTSSTNSSSDSKTLLSARTILRRILQEHQKEQQGEALTGSMNYTIDEEAAIIDDDDDDVHGSSSTTPHNRNGVRSNSHNPGTVTLNPNDISSLSPPTSSSSSPDETDVNHQTSPNSLSRPSSTPAALISSGY